MRLLCIADVHCRFGRFNPAELDDADLVIVAGDLTDYGVAEPIWWLKATEWLSALADRYERVFWIPGNHDIRIEGDVPDRRVQNILRKVAVDPRFPDVRFYGESLTPAFDFPELTRTWVHMTDDPYIDSRAWEDVAPVEVVVSHGPPFGHLDSAGYDLETRSVRHIGSPGLLAYIERNQPRLVICGHNHGGGGKETTIGATRIVNTAERATVIEI